MAPHDDWLKEAPSQAHQLRVETAVQRELEQIEKTKRDTYFWRWLVAAIPLGTTFAFIFWNRSVKQVREPLTDGDLLAAVHIDSEIEAEDIDSFEDLDVIEVLEEMEKWTS